MRWFIRLFWLLPLGFYLSTASTTPGWVDAPLIARTVYRLELSTWVNHHNLFTLIGHAWLLLTPFLDPHYALNLLCALFGAATVFVVFRVGLRLTQSVWASALGATLLMVSHSLWWHSTMLEVYTLSTLLLSLTLLLVVRFDQTDAMVELYGASFVLGLACSNHVQMGLLVFGAVTLLVSLAYERSLSWRRAVGLAACFLGGFQIYLWIFGWQLAELVRSGTELNEALAWMIENTTGGGFKRYMFPDGLGFRDRAFWWAYFGLIWLYNFPPPWLLFAPFGLASWWTRRELRASFSFFAGALGAQLVWSSNYFVWDMFAFSLPAYVLASVAITMGIDWVARRSAGWRSLVLVLSPTVLLIPWMYSLAPSLVADSDRAIGYFERIPQYSQAAAFWEPFDYFLNPNKWGYRRVELYARAIERVVDDDACFWGNEATMFYPLQFYYQDVLGVRRDISYHLIFGMLEDQADYRAHASVVARQLDRGCTVYFSSLGFPERDVLNQVYARLDGKISPHVVATLSELTLVRDFPHYRLEPVAIDRGGVVRLWKLVGR